MSLCAHSRRRLTKFIPIIAFYITEIQKKIMPRTVKLRGEICLNMHEQYTLSILPDPNTNTGHFPRVLNLSTRTLPSIKQPLQARSVTNPSPHKNNRSIDFAASKNTQFELSTKCVHVEKLLIGEKQDPEVRKQKHTWMRSVSEEETFQGGCRTATEKCCAIRRRTQKFLLVMTTRGGRLRDSERKHNNHFESCPEQNLIGTIYQKLDPTPIPLSTIVAKGIPHTPRNLIFRQVVLV